MNKLNDEDVVAILEVKKSISDIAEVLDMKVYLPLYGNNIMIDTLLIEVGNSLDNSEEKLEQLLKWNYANEEEK